MFEEGSEMACRGAGTAADVKESGELASMGSVAVDDGLI